jgi:hypothetical protein
MAPYFETIRGKLSARIDENFTAITFKNDAESSAGVKVDGSKRIKLSLIGSVYVRENNEKKTKMSSPDNSLTKSGSIVVSESDFTVGSSISGEERSFVYIKN